MKLLRGFVITLLAVTLSSGVALGAPEKHHIVFELLGYQSNSSISSGPFSGVQTHDDIKLYFVLDADLYQNYGNRRTYVIVDGHVTADGDYAVLAVENGGLDITNSPGAPDSLVLHEPLDYGFEIIFSFDSATNWINTNNVYQLSGESYSYGEIDPDVGMNSKLTDPVLGTINFGTQYLKFYDFPYKAADFDYDLVVGFSDLSMILQNWGPVICFPGCNSEYDLSGDGQIGFVDLTILLSDYGYYYM